MAINRDNVPMTVERYLAIEGRIVSRMEGLTRRHMQDNYEIIDGKFVTKKMRQMLEAKKAPLGVASKEPSEESEEFKNYVATNLGFIQSFTSTLSVKGEFDKTVFNDIQAYLMNSEDPFLWANKTRQVGFSFVLAARGLAKALLKWKHTAIFVSYNEEESKEKVTYARELYESLPMKWRLARKLKYDNKTSLVFEKSGDNSSETRILSYPQRIIRGKGGELDIALDEAAHCIHIRKIYTSAMPALSRSSQSTLWVGSSPAGKGGLFYEIGVNQEGEYGPFVRMTVPWWVVPEFCKDVKSAREAAWDMHTDERVALFASDRIRMIRKSMPIDDFQQEYECVYLDEAYSYFPWDIINKCVPIFNVEAQDATDFDSPAQDLSEEDKFRSGVGIQYYKNFEDFYAAVRRGEIKGNILGGFDVGRTTDKSEIVYVEENPDTYRQTVRCCVTMKNVPLPEQRRIAKEQFDKLGARLTKFGVDYNGIGRNIAEDLEELSYDTVVKLNFNNNAWKEEACRRFKLRLDNTAIDLPTDRTLLTQIHSIKRVLLPGGLWRFDTEKNTKHHGDKFWGLLGASEVGHPMREGDTEFTPCDQRVFTGNLIAPKTRNVGVITAERASNIIKFNPWGSISPMLSGIAAPGLPVPRMPQVLEGTFNTPFHPKR